MAGEWVKRKIGALGRVVTGKTPPTSDSSNYGGPYLFITIPDLNGRVFIDRTERTISEKGAKLIASSLLPPGSVMMSCIATVGKCGITTAPSFTNQQINSVIPNDDVDPRFLYYAFTELGHQLEAIGAGGSVYTNVSKKRFSDIEVTLPVDINEQRAIAHILGTLDDKIELNRRMSETLEAMARALFKAWFVDFEPVRAKMEGRWQRGQSLPGLPAHLYDLFPDRLADSELGEIPEGWRIDQISNHFRVTMGQSPPGNTYNEKGDGLPFYQGRVDFGFRFPTRRVFCTAPTRLADAGDTLVTVRAPVGDSNMALERCCIGRGVAAVRHTSGAVSYTYYFVRSLKLIFESFEAEGTVFGAITKDAFLSIKCVVPPTELVQRFEQLCCPIDEKIERAERESRTLAAVRDALLPKLIRGEIRVKDAERFLKERISC